MTNQERHVRAESIVRRQNAGKITKREASAEFDRLLDETAGDLHYYSDTTGMKADWNPLVMAFPHRDDITQPSNAGIITQGPQRGEIVTKLTDVPNAKQEVVAHFADLSLREAKANA